MTALARIYFTSFLVLSTVMRSSSRHRGFQQSPQCQCPMDIVHVGDACSCTRQLSYDVEAPRPVEEPDTLKEYGFRVEVPYLADLKEQQQSYHVEVDVPVDRKSPSLSAAHGYKVEVPRSPDAEQLRSYVIDVQEPGRVAPEKHLEYGFHIDRMAVPRKDCCICDD